LQKARLNSIRPALTSNDMLGNLNTRNDYQNIYAIENDLENKLNNTYNNYLSGSNTRHIGND